MNLHLRSTYYCMPSAVPALGIQGAIKRNKEPCSCGACVSVEEDRQETRDNKEVNYIPVRRGSVLQEKKKNERGTAAAAAAKSLQSCPTLCDPIDGSPPGSSIPGILQARTLEWVAISFSNALQSCPTLCNPMDSSPPGSSVHGIL